MNDDKRELSEPCTAESLEKLTAGLSDLLNSFQGGDIPPPHPYFHLLSQHQPE